MRPRTRNMIRAAGLVVAENVKLVEPVGHFDILILQENANCVLTDSGGMQKEAYVLGVRCITLREETEWVEKLYMPAGTSSPGSMGMPSKAYSRPGIPTESARRSMGTGMLRGRFVRF